MRFLLLSAVLAIAACSLYEDSSSDLARKHRPDAGTTGNDAGSCGGPHDGGGYLPDAYESYDGGGYLPDGGFVTDAGDIKDGGSWLPDAAHH